MAQESCAKPSRRGRSDLITLLCIAVLSACGGTEQKGTPSVQATTSEVPYENALARIDLGALDDNVRNDTLLIHTTYQLSDGTFIMAARAREDKFEGLRFYHYELLPDSNAQVLSYSAPAYDSWIMLPTFFGASSNGMPTLILAEFGERQSWGMKAMRFGENGFQDIGFLDVARKEMITDNLLPGERPWATRTAAPKTVVQEYDDSLVFRFNGDSILVFDDLRGHIDANYSAGAISYRYFNDSLELRIAQDALLPSI